MEKERERMEWNSQMLLSCLFSLSLHWQGPDFVPKTWQKIIIMKERGQKKVKKP